MCLHLLLLCLSKMFSFTLWMQQFNRQMISSDSFMLPLLMFITIVDDGRILASAIKKRFMELYSFMMSHSDLQYHIMEE